MRKLVSAALLAWTFVWAICLAGQASAASPNDPANLSQFKTDGTPITAGNTTEEATIILSGLISDPDGGTVQLQIEVAPVGDLHGTPNLFSAFMPSGSTPQVPFNIPADGSYEWQARTFDGTSYSPNPWTSAGFAGADFVAANTPPADPANLWQYRTDGTTQITAGGTTNESTILLTGLISDPGGDQVQLQIEVAPVGGLTGTPNLFSVFVPSGSTVQVPFSILSAGSYEWQARTVDARGAYSPSAWTSAGFPGADFVATLSPLLISPEGDNKVYWVDQGVARHIPNPETFELLRFDWSTIQQLTAAEFSAYPIGSPLYPLRTGNARDGSLIRRVGSNEVYLIENGVGRHVPDPDTLFAMGRRFDEVLDLEEHIWRVPIGAPLPSVTSPDFVYLIANLGVNPASSYLFGVNAANGNFLYQDSAFDIPGRGMPFRFSWNYNAQDSFSGDLGPGWIHSFNVEAREFMRNGTREFVNVKWGDGHEEVYDWDGSVYQPVVNYYKSVSGGGAGSSLTIVDRGRITYTFALESPPETIPSVDTNGTATSVTNSQYRLSTVADRNGNTLTLHYSDRLDSITDTSGRTINFVYSQVPEQQTQTSVRRLTSVIDPIGRAVQFSYDANARLASVTDPGLGVTRFTYKPGDPVMGVPNPLLESVTDPRGNPVLRADYTDIDHSTPMVSDPNFRKVSSIMVDGMPYSVQFDATTTTVASPNEPAKTFGFDSSGRLLTVDPGDGNAPLRKQFVDPGTPDLPKSVLPATITDRNNQVTSFAYDPVHGGVESITAPLGAGESAIYDPGTHDLTQKTDALGRTTNYTYDANGNVITIAAPIGTTHVTYNPFGQPLTVTDPNSNVTTYVYDPDGNVAEIQEPLGRTTRFTYDGVGRKVTQTDANGNLTRFAYDGNDNLVTMTDAQDNVTTYGYDANGNRTSVTDANNNTTTYEYDARNRRITVIEPGSGATTRYTYDDYDRMKSVTDGNNHVTSFDYDAAGNLITVTDADSKTVRYTYDGNGNRLTMEDPNLHVTTYTYDALNRLLTETGPATSPAQYRYEYDLAGNRTAMVDAKGQRTEYTYEDMNRPLVTTFPDTSTITHTYDLNGNRTQMVDSLGASTYSYDALNRLTAYSDPVGQTVGYGYDPNNNRTSITYPGGKVVQYGFDALNRLETVTDWLSRTTTYSYDPAGRLTGVANPNGTSSTYTYDIANRLTGLLNSKSNGAVISSYSYVLDRVGNQIQVNQVEPLAPVLPDLTVSYGYDAENRITNAGGINYTHDANGNMTAKGADRFTYDYRDKLTGSVISGVSSSYGYDGDGNRLVKTENGVTTRYVQNINGNLPNVLMERDGAGNITAYYVYGLGLVEKVFPDETARYYHYDSQGSTIALTDSAGGITDSYAYDSFGQVASSSGSTDNSFKYVGRSGLVDEGNGLTYVRSRYYLPTLGRFISKDSLVGDGRDTQSINRYSYAFNNPLSMIDPGGHFPFRIEKSLKIARTLVDFNKFAIGLARPVPIISPRGLDILMDAGRPLKQFGIVLNLISTGEELYTIKRGCSVDGEECFKRVVSSSGAILLQRLGIPLSPSGDQLYRWADWLDRSVGNPLVRAGLGSSVENPIIRAGEALGGQAYDLLYGSPDQVINPGF